MQLADAPNPISDALHGSAAQRDAGIVLWLANHGERMAVKG